MAKNTEYHLNNMVISVGMYNEARVKWHDTDVSDPLFTSYIQQMFDHALRAIHYAEIAGFNGRHICASQAAFIDMIKDSDEYNSRMKFLEKHYAKRVKDAKAAA